MIEKLIRFICLQPIESLRNDDQHDSGKCLQKKLAAAHSWEDIHLVQLLGAESSICQDHVQGAVALAGWHQCEPRKDELSLNLVGDSPRKAHVLSDQKQEEGQRQHDKLVGINHA